MRKNDPLFKLFDYACGKMYRVIYNTHDFNDERAAVGMLINCHGPMIVLLSEKGLHYIKHKDIQFMDPIPMPKHLSDEYRITIETYLKEEAEFGRM